MHKNKNVVYNIPCGCGKYSYTGETDRKWKTRRKEHMDKVRLTQEDIANGNIDRATERMNTGDGGLAKHNTTCLWSQICDKIRLTIRHYNTTLQFDISI